MIWRDERERRLFRRLAMAGVVLGGAWTLVALAQGNWAAAAASVVWSGWAYTARRVA